MRKWLKMQPSDSTPASRIVPSNKPACRRAGFAIIEMPVVMLLLGLVTLGLAFALWLKTGRVAWFLWVLGGLLFILSLTLFVLMLEPPNNRNKK